MSIVQKGALSNFSGNLVKIPISVMQDGTTNAQLFDRLMILKFGENF